MAKFIWIATLLISISLQAQTEYSNFRTTITCPVDKDELVSSAHEKIKSALATMANEGSIINFQAEKEKNKDNIKLIYRVPAENEESFRKIIETWKKNAGITDQKLMADFWQACPTRKDTIAGKHRYLYPVIKDPGSMVVVVAGIDEKPDPKLDYKVVIDFTGFSYVDEKNKSKVDSSQINWVLSEIGRYYNLHVAAGIPKNKLQIVAAVHANAMVTFFTNAAYKEKYKIDNPNLSLIEALNKEGVKFLVCGQSLTWWGFRKDMLMPTAKVTLTAQTTLSSYQMKGYALKKMGND